MIRYALSLLVAALLLAVGPMPRWIEAAPAPKPTETEKDQATFQGTWSGVSFEREDAVKMDASNTVLTFKDGKFTLIRANQILLAGKFTIDASKDPRTIDMTVTLGLARGKKVLGVYNLKDDTLKWCWFDPNYDHVAKPRGRPEVDPKIPGDYLYTFKKSKP